MTMHLRRGRLRRRLERDAFGVIVDSSRKSTLSRIEELGARIS